MYLFIVFGLYLVCIFPFFGCRGLDCHGYGCCGFGCHELHSFNLSLFFFSWYCAFVCLLYCDLFFPPFLHATIFLLLCHSAMVYLLMHCIAGSAALLWSSVAFFLFFFKYYIFCNTGCISVRASYEATTILFSTFFFSCTRHFDDIHCMLPLCM